MRKRCSRTRSYSWKERSELRDEWQQSINARVFQNAPFDRKRAAPRQIRDLPAVSSNIYTHQAVYGWRSEVREMITGTRDHKSPLKLLRGLEDTIVRHIFSYTKNEFADHITMTIPACYVGCLHMESPTIGRYTRGRCVSFGCVRDVLKELPLTSRVVVAPTEKTHATSKQGFVSFAVCGSVQFPEPTNVNVNMLPFIVGKKSSLPLILQPYYGCIEKCPYPEEDVGKIGYLTVHESFVKSGTTQRKGGLRIMNPQLLIGKDGAAFSPALEKRCGEFLGPDMYEGGTYMASNVSGTCEVWDALLDKRFPRAVDEHGGCEHLRRLIGPATKLKANQIVWMTDCTPYQEKPLDTSCYQQFFRVVTTNISHWFADYSTPNPLVSLPDDVVVVSGTVAS